MKTNLGLSKSAIASDSSNLQSAKYPIWKALQKLYKGCLHKPPKSCTFASFLYPLTRHHHFPLFVESSCRNQNKSRPQQISNSFGQQQPTGCQVPNLESPSKPYKGFVHKHPKRLHICCISLSFERVSPSSLCDLLPK